MNHFHSRLSIALYISLVTAYGIFANSTTCGARPSPTADDAVTKPIDPPHRPITAVAWDTAGLQIVAASDAQIEILDPRSLQRVWKISVEMQKICQLAFSADAKHLLVAGGNPSEMGCVELYDWTSKKLLARHTNISLKASSSDSSERTKASFRDVVTSVCWLSDQSGWIEGSWQGLGLVRSLDGIVVNTFDGHSGPILTVACLDDQHAVSAGIDQTIRLWNRNNGAEVKSLDNHTGSVTWLQSKPNPRDSTARQLLSASEDSTIRLWEPSIGRLVRFARLSSAPIVVCSSSKESRLLVGLENNSILELDMLSLETKVLQESNVSDPSQKSAAGARIEAMLAVPALEHESPGEVIVWRQSGVSRLQH